MSFKITGLDGNHFSQLYGLTDDKLKSQGVVRLSIDEYPSYPDRITLRDIPVGETALLLNHTFIDTDSPYKGSHAIFIWEGQLNPSVYLDIIPEVVERRIMSLRGYDKQDMLIEANIAQPGEARDQILTLLMNDRIEFILAHHARQGCFSCRIERN